MTDQFRALNIAARRLGSAAVMLGFVLAGAVGTQTSAWAGPNTVEPFHLRLVKSEPAKDDSVAAAPSSIKLWFSQKPELAVTSIKLTAADGKPISLGAPRLDGSDQSLVVADVKGSVPAGALTVAWKTSSGDGHAITGSILFIVRTSTQGTR